MNGTLVRTFKRDVSGQDDEFITGTDEIKKSKRIPYLDWDLKNQYGIPVASGLYHLPYRRNNRWKKLRENIKMVWCNASFRSTELLTLITLKRV